MSYRAEAEAAHLDGFTYFDQLGGRVVEDGIELWLRVQNPTSHEMRLIKTVITAVDALESVPDLSVPDLSVPDLSVPELSVPELSVADLWGGARWAEAEVVASFPVSGGFAPSSGGFAPVSGGFAQPEEVQ